MLMQTPIWMWIAFISLILGFLILDLGFFHRKNREIQFKESLWMSAFYMAIALLFGLWIWHMKGLNSFAEYMTGFLIEKSLALDNIFLISLIFSALSIPLQYQHRVLFWGILGVIVMRAIMIGLGVHIMNRFEWVLYVFAVVMIVTGIKMFFVGHQPIDMSKNTLLIWMRRHLRVTNQLQDEKFYVHQIDPVSQTKKIFVTPLFIALIMVEFIDLVFAIDSIPAIFAITNDAYIIYTSNIFAILGLRALYFALAAIVKRFYYLKYALAAILIFIGSKIFIADFFEIGKVPPMISLGVTLTLLTAGILLSWKRNKTNILSSQ